MVARNRFGGLFSILSRRDLVAIDTMERQIEAQPPFNGDDGEWMAELWLEDDPPVHFSGAAPSYSLQELEDHLQHAKDWLSSFLQGELRIEFRGSQADRIGYAEEIGRIRSWIITIDKVLKKIKKGRQTLENEELS